VPDGWAIAGGASWKDRHNCRVGLVTWHELAPLKASEAVGCKHLSGGVCAASVRSLD